MTINKGGYTALALCILFIFILNAFIQFYHPQSYHLKWVIYIASFILLLSVMLFFRSPIFKVNSNEAQVLCPANGKIIEIEEAEETEFLKDPRIRLSIAISPFSVHVNRSPVNGIIRYFKHNPNEGTAIVTEINSRIQVLSRHFARALSGSIIWEVAEGGNVKQGQQLSFSKFGSRTDVFLPLGSVVTVNIGDVVKGGLTVLAELPLV